LVVMLCMVYKGGRRVGGGLGPVSGVVAGGIAR